LAGNIACMGPMNEVVFTTAAAGGLTRNGVPSVADVVSFQAQYGLTIDPPGAGNSAIASWVNATIGVAPDLAFRRRIRAIRIALITRSNAYEKEVVSFACTPAAPKPNQSCIWTGDATPINVDLVSLGADWDHYRYNVFEAIIPLRSMVWSSNTL
jgi:type IV pilus assembly protein PilW